MATCMGAGRSAFMLLCLAFVWLGLAIIDASLGNEWW